MIKSIRQTLKMAQLNKKCTYLYLTPIEKPVTSLALSSIVELSAQTLQYCHLEFGLVPELSVVAGAFAFRVGLEFAGLFFQSLNLKNKENWVGRWIQKIFLVDLRRDITFYELPPESYSSMASYYKPEQLFTNFLKTYTLLNLLRGAHYIIDNRNFLNFYNSEILTLSVHDPSFLLPLAVIALNYFILSRSKHPFFIHLVRKENKLMCFNIAFMSGLLLVASPAIYPLAYIGIASAHLSIRSLKNRTESWRSFFVNALRRKKQ